MAKFVFFSVYENGSDEANLDIKVAQLKMSIRKMNTIVEKQGSQKRSRDIFPPKGKDKSYASCCSALHNILLVLYFNITSTVCI